MTTEFTLERAQDFIKKNTPVKDFYPQYNFSAPIGWINDPNGVSIFNNELHLFYQHYPYDSIHGEMHWGHAKTKDGVNWDHLDVALAPDQPYDKDGVFSGSAIEKDGKLYLMYTGHLENDEGEVRQNQNIAISSDGIKFEKYSQNPVLDKKDVPEGSSIADFRDPKVFQKNGQYYAVIGSKTQNDKGQVLLYESDDLLNWKFASVILPYNKFLGDMVECPDLLLFNDKDVFLLSAMNYTDENTGEFYPHISWLIEGKVNWNTLVFEVDSIRKMDGGFDFYAPQTTQISSKPNKYLAIAWQQAWNRTLPPHEEGHKWVGQMTIPRVLTEEKNKIIQRPYNKILSKMSTNTIKKELNLNEIIEINFNYNYFEFKMKSTDQVKLSLQNNNSEKIILNFDSINNKVDFSRKHTIEISDENERIFDEIEYPISLQEEVWKVQVFVDTSSIQVFINDYYTLSSTFYSYETLNKLLLESDKGSSMFDFKLGTLNLKEGN